MRLFRIQDKYADGPFARDGKDCADRDAAFELIHELEGIDPMRSSDWHPCPWYDEKLMLATAGLHRNSMKFAFANMEQVNRWFRPEYREILALAGFHLYELEAKQAFIGSTQAMFFPCDLLDWRRVE